jgi:hypothetical protein
MKKKKPDCGVSLCDLSIYESMGEKIYDRSRGFHQRSNE